MKNTKILIMIMILCIALTACGSSNTPAETTADETDINKTTEETGERPSGAGGEAGEKPEGATGQGAQSGQMQGGGTATAVNVELQSIELQSISQQSNTMGKVNAETLITIGANTSSTIEQINVSVGDKVSIGDVLYTVDDDSIINSSNSQSTTASNNVASAKLNYDNALDTYNDNKILFDSGVISKSDLDNSYSSLELAEINYNNAKSSYSATVSSSGYSIEDTILEAPINGVISEINASVGQKSSQSDIVIIGDNNLIVTTVVSNKIIDDLSVGKKVDMTYGDIALTGTIYEVGEVGINNTDSFEVSISVDDSELLKVGYNVDVIFEVFEMNDQIVVPKKTILTDEKGDYIYLNNDATAKKVYITQGYTNDGYVQIFGEVNAGDEILISGQNFVTDGDPIVIVEY